MVVEVGQRLSEARRRRNLSLADISRTTRIPLHYLEAIDRDDVDRMPRGFFARAFVRTYANEVGVNPDELLDNIDEPVSAEPEPSIPTPAATVDGSPLSMRPLFLTISAAVLFGAYYFAAVRTTTSEAPQVAAEIPAPTTAHVEPVAARIPDATSDVELQIHSSGGCIVAVTADGQAIPSHTKLPGQQVLLKARGEVILRVGDAGTCPPAVKPIAAPKLPRRSQIDTVPPFVEPVPPDASNAALPQPDEPAPPPIIEQF